jgi:hypothetical protein
MFKNNQNLSDVLNRNYSNNEFEGFCVDLLDEISRVLKFNYKIKPITSGRYDDMVEEVKNKVRQDFNLKKQNAKFSFFLSIRLLI